MVLSAVTEQLIHEWKPGRTILDVLTDAFLPLFTIYTNFTIHIDSGYLISFQTFGDYKIEGLILNTPRNESIYPCL